jgi:LysM repeat protein
MAHASEASPASAESARQQPKRTTSIKARAVATVLVLAFAVAAASADYVVQRGDTLTHIASEYGISVSELAAANGISDPNRIIVGQQLAIPGQTITHEVERGETLREIAAEYGVSVQDIATANGIANPNVIQIGSKLMISSSPALTNPSAAATYTVQKGDSLAAIAARFDTTVEALAAANGITDPGLIYIGATLHLSGAAFVAEPAPSSANYTVKVGDRLISIASTYGIAVSTIAAANNLSNPNVIRIGQVLVIPGAASGWRCPVDGAKYINDWGFPRSGGRAHEGNDLFAARGTPVYAPVAGDVTFLDGRLGGLQFWLKGDDGATYIGTHLDTMGSPGRVPAGSKLGTVGNTGNAATTRPHLHFEIHPNHGAAANPYPTLRANGC